jgi:hypothetical protein
MMCAVINNSVSCEIRAVVCLLHAKNMSAAKIHHEICAAYAQNVISKGI